MSYLRNFIFRVRTTGWRSVIRSVFKKLMTSKIIFNRFLVQIKGHKLQRIQCNFHDYTTNDLVTVVLPVNNGRSRGVERLVTSLKSQSHKEIELIAVDSGSTDDTVHWLRREGFNVIEINPESFTHAFSRNVGASHAQGRFILFVVDDVIFTNKDWLKTAIYLLEKFDADSLSSSQTVDEHADSYAQCLNGFLIRAQSSHNHCINISKNTALTTWLRKFLPFQSQYPSMCIDNTNHLTRRETFNQFKFKAPSVEDIDYAKRLVEAKKKVIFTNFLSVTHYHSYKLEGLGQYAKRVYLDLKTMNQWNKCNKSFESLDSLFSAAFHVLILFIQISHDKEIISDNLDNQKVLVNKIYIDNLYQRLSSRVQICINKNDKKYEFVKNIFSTYAGNKFHPTIKKPFYETLVFLNILWIALSKSISNRELDSLPMLNNIEFKNCLYLFMGKHIYF